MCVCGICFADARPNIIWIEADDLESSLIPAEGLPDQTWTYWEVPVYCAHPHAWPLYCYYKLQESANVITVGQ